MNAYATYAGKRLLQFALVVFIGINLAFVITHSTPIDPVEQTVATATAFGSTSPEAVEMMRQSLRELYGLGGSLWSQYAVFWKRIVVGDFGPSLSAFPTPVSVLINRALPWTIGLLTVSTVLAWILGNLLGGLAGYYRDSKLLKIAGVLAMGVHPIPYYIVAFVFLIVFGYVWPVLPITGGSQMNVQWGWNASFILSVLRHSILPVASLVLVGPSPRYLDDAGYVGGFTRADIDELLASMEANHRAWSSAMAPVIMGNHGRPELGRQLTESFCRTDPVIARDFARVTFLSDNRADLPRVTVPTLVLQCAEDPIAPQPVGEYVHATGHCPNVSAPGETIQAIRSTL